MSFVLRTPSGEIVTTDTRKAADNLIFGLGYRDITAEYEAAPVEEPAPAVEPPAPAPKPSAKAAVKETKERPTSGNVTRSEGSSTPEDGK